MNKNERIEEIGARNRPMNYQWLDDDGVEISMDGHYTAQQLREIAEVMEQTSC